MLIEFAQNEHQVIKIGEDITITIKKVNEDNGRVKFEIIAPPDVKIVKVPS